MLPLTRTARLADFPGCVSAADWQQRHAERAYERWLALDPHPLGPVTCYNWGAATFRAPGDDPIYHGGGDLNGDGELSAIFALSVLDRVDSPMKFLRTVSRRLQYGGLLVATFAAWDATGPDCALGCELRKRIFDRELWYKLLGDVRTCGLQPFGGVDLRYRGDLLGDHTLGALTVIKQDGRS